MTNKQIASRRLIKLAIDAVQRNSRDLREMIGNKGGATRRLELIEQNQKIEVD